MNKSHKYYYQVLGQLATTGLEKCVLVLYTHKGIFPLDIKMDHEKWSDMERKLTQFYKECFYPVLRANAKACMS